MNNLALCATCQAPAGQSCVTKSGKPAKTHSNRQQLVPVAALPPVRAISERFTLKGQALPVSACMKKLGLALEVDGSAIQCQFESKPGTWMCWVFDTKLKTWEFAEYADASEEFDSKPVEKWQVVFAMMRRFYEMPRAARPDLAVLSSLGSHLKLSAPAEKLDTLRAELRAVTPGR